MLPKGAAIARFRDLARAVVSPRDRGWRPFQRLQRKGQCRPCTGYRTSKVVGSTVVNEANKTVGKLDDLIVTPKRSSSKLKGVVCPQGFGDPWAQTTLTAM
jgi:hypothetical protein